MSRLAGSQREGEELRYHLKELRAGQTARSVRAENSRDVILFLFRPNKKSTLPAVNSGTRSLGPTAATPAKTAAPTKKPGCIRSQAPQYRHRRV